MSSYLWIERGELVFKTKESDQILYKKNVDKKDAFYEKRKTKQIFFTKIVEETYQKHWGSISASSDKVESEGREMKQC
jgi:hypothetical protein